MHRIYFSVDIDWSNLDVHLTTYQKEIIQTDGDGYCLINAIIKSLEIDYGIIKC